LEERVMRILRFLGVLVTLGVLLGACSQGSLPSFGPSKYATSVASTGEPFKGPMPNERLAMRQVAAAMIPTVPTSTAEYRAAKKLFPWKVVGGDPCNPKVGCTLEWALNRAVAQGFMPRDVADEFLRMVPNMPGEEVLVPVGVVLDWGTWGKFSPKFVPYVLTDFRDGQPQPAKRWTVRRPGVGPYNLYQFKACGNWAGDRSETPPGPPSDIPQAYCL
jgi:hypothetical protein